MKKTKAYVYLLAFGLLGGGMLTAALSPGQITGVIRKPVATQPYDDTKDQQTFMGKIMQNEGKFVLVDSRSNATFLLDDQEKAKPFDGKAVKVTGKLDAEHHIIHVVDIQEVV